MRAHLRLLLLAVQFYTRLPVPTWVGYSDELLNKATVYFPLVGWLVGAWQRAFLRGPTCCFAVPT